MFGRKKKIVVKMTDAELKASIIQSFQVIPDLVLDAGCNIHDIYEQSTPEEREKMLDELMFAIRIYDGAMAKFEKRELRAMTAMGALLYLASGYHRALSNYNDYRALSNARVETVAAKPANPNDPAFR